MKPFQKGLVAISGLFLFLLWIQFRIAPFTSHIDEFINQADVKYSIEHRTLLPERFTYPSLTHDIALLSLLPDLLGREKILDVVSKDEFVVRMRRIVAVISALSLFWIYFLLFEWKKNWWAAFFGAGIFGLSWEIAYHSCRFTVDAVAIQFTALTLMFMMLSHLRRSWPHLFLAVLSATLAFASKYTFVLLFFPVFLQAVFLHQEKPLSKKSSRTLMGTIMGAAAVFLLITPGFLFKAKILTNYIFSIGAIYLAGNQFNYVRGPWDHLFRILEYLIFAASSPYGAMSCLLFCLAAVGGWGIWRENKKTATLLFLYPVIVVLTISQFKMMYVRNYLPLVPFISISAALGANYLVSKLSHPISKNSFSVLMAGFLMANALWLVRWMGSVRNYDPVVVLEQLSQYAADRPQEKFLFSPGLAERYEHAAAALPPNVVWDYKGPYDRAVFTGRSAGFYKPGKISEYTARINALYWNGWKNNRYHWGIASLGKVRFNPNYQLFDDRVILIVPRSTAEGMSLFKHS